MGTFLMIFYVDIKQLFTCVDCMYRSLSLFSLVQFIMCFNNSKEAQKCYCEALNCRGWIGETPEEEKEKIEKKETRERDTKKKEEEKKPADDYMEDEDVSTILQIVILHELTLFGKQ